MSSIESTPHTRTPRELPVDVEDILSVVKSIRGDVATLAFHASKACFASDAIDQDHADVTEALHNIGEALGCISHHIRKEGGAP